MNMTTDLFGDWPEERRSLLPRRRRTDASIRFLSERRDVEDRRSPGNGPPLSLVPSTIGEVRLPSSPPAVSACWDAGFVSGMTMMILITAIAFLLAALIDGANSHVTGVVH